MSVYRDDSTASFQISYGNNRLCVAFGDLARLVSLLIAVGLANQKGVLCGRFEAIPNEFFDEEQTADSLAISPENPRICKRERKDYWAVQSPRVKKDRR